MTRTHRSKPRARRPVVRKTGNARDAIGTLEPGAELYILTFGQFSLMDAILVLLEQAGPAEVVLATWTAADADLTTTARLVEQAAITRLRMIVDRSFASRQPDYCATMRELFGDDCIRTVRSHAKFVAIRNERWSLAVRTSMNLNQNPRMENIEISDDPALCGFLEQVADDLFAEQPPGDLSGGLPGLRRHDAPGRSGVSRIGKVTLGG